MHYVEPLIGLVGGLLAALLGALATHVLATKRASDRCVLEVWRAAFDRSAFKGTYDFHSDQERFKSAIRLTIQSVNTGVLQNRKGTVFKTSKPKGEIKRKEWRRAGELLERELNRLVQLIPDSPARPSAEIKSQIESIRSEIIRVLNEVLAQGGLPLLPPPSEATEYNDVFSE
jgi:hypothetical protein